MAYKINSETQPTPGRFTYPQGTYLPSQQIPYPGQFGTQAAGLLGAGFGSTPAQPQPPPPQPQIIQPVVSLTGINNAAGLTQSNYGTIYNPPPPQQPIITPPVQYTGANNILPAQQNQQQLPSWYQNEYQQYINQEITPAHPSNVPSWYQEEYRAYNSPQAQLAAQQQLQAQYGQQYPNIGRNLTDAQRRYIDVYGQLPTGGAPPVDIYNRKFIPGDQGPLGLLGGYTDAQRRYIDLYGKSPIGQYPTVANGLLNQNFAAPYDVNTPINPFANTQGTPDNYGSGGSGGSGGGSYKYPKAKENVYVRSLRWRVATG